MKGVTILVLAILVTIVSANVPPAKRGYGLGTAPSSPRQHPSGLLKKRNWVDFGPAVSDDNGPTAEDDELIDAALKAVLDELRDEIDQQQRRQNEAQQQIHRRAYRTMLARMGLKDKRPGKVAALQHPDETELLDKRALLERRAIFEKRALFE